MVKQLAGWKGSIEVNNSTYTSVAELANMELKGTVNIKLHPVNKKPEISTKSSVQQASNGTEYVITVRQYMTCKATPDFDFMAKWNNNVPMPMRTMVGVKIKETPGMVYMKLHGDIIAKQTCNCMQCGRKITNPVSQYFGMGPECGEHNYTNPFDTDEELQAAVAEYKEKLRKVTWEGWIIKKAIEREEVK